jgi:hypothetical protein
MKIKALIGAGIIAGSMLVGSAAGAAVTFDAATGTGFVGKGDVQTVLGLNNKQLNEAEKAGLTFTYESVDTTVTEVAWECTNDKNEKVQERERTTTATTEVSGVVSATARDNKKQITGFHMNGFSSTTATSTSTTEGNSSTPARPRAGTGR